MKFQCFELPRERKVGSRESEVRESVVKLHCSTILRRTSVGLSHQEVLKIEIFLYKFHWKGFK